LKFEQRSETDFALLTVSVFDGDAAPIALP